MRETGSLRGDLLAIIRPWVKRLRTRPYGRVISSLLAETHTDPEFADYYRARFVEVRRDPARAVVRSAIGRGELPPDTDVDLALDLIYHRILHGHAPLTDRFAENVVDTALRGLGYTPSPTAGSSRLRRADRG